MSYCINPYCSKRQNPDAAKLCQTCGTELLILYRYRLVQPLRPLRQAYHTEIFAVEDRGTPKVLKVLKSDEDSLKLVELFEQEAKILRYLKHPGIPQAELDGYFTFLLSDGKILRCLVMEKIQGQDLQHWIEEHGAISPEQALGWLRQLAEILAHVHRHEFFHRDIKPSNIMLKPDGQLVLIDFGTARKVTQTVIEGQNVTVVYSHGYTAPEQIEGKAVPQSDFFALGRTFVHLLTGNPDDLDATTEKQLWRYKKSKISKQLADLINHLTARLPKNRPQDANFILQRLNKIERENFRDQKSNPRNKLLLAMLGSGAVLVSGVVVFILVRTRPICFSDVPNIPQGLFNYGGSTTWAPIRQLVDPDIQTALPKFRLQYENPTPEEGTPGSTTGIKMLVNGRLAVAQSSRPFLQKENQQAQLQGFFLKQESVALDGIAVVVNPQLNLPGLTVAQLRGIYTGKIRNWKEVGGANDTAIAPHAHRSIVWFSESVLQGERFGSNVKYVTNTTQGLRQIAQNPGGIYYASAPLVVPQCIVRPLPIGFQPGKFIAPYQEPFIPNPSCLNKTNQVNQKVFKNGQYPLTRNLFVIFKDFPGNDNIEEKAGKAYVNLLLTDEGQRLIEKAGFVRIRFSDRGCLLP